jgi:hypothetical protein
MAETLKQQEDITPKIENPNQENSKNGKIDENKLTKQEVDDLKEGKTSISKLAQERQLYKQAAKAEMQGLLRLEKKNEVVDFDEYKELKKECEELEQEIEETQSPEKMKGILEKIKKIPKKREEAKRNKDKQNEKDKKEIDVNSKELQEMRLKFNNICDKNANLIGTNQVPGFKKWFELELRKNPTMKRAQEIIDKLEGEKTYDREGLAPRREAFRDLEQIFKKYQINSPLESKYIKAEGLSERQTFLKEARNAESEVKRGNDAFWSKEAKQKTMRQVLKANSPHEIKELTIQIKKINSIESEGFIYMKNTMQVDGTSVRKMSDSSIDKFLQGLKNEGDIDQRIKYITGNGKYSNGIKEAVENEGSLAGKEVNAQTASLFGIKKGLEGIYEGRPNELKIAIKSFETLDFMQKIAALKEHQNLVEKTDTKEALGKTLTVKAAHSQIDEAARKKTLSKDTQKKYKEWFTKEENYKNPKTGNPGDLETLKKYFEILTSKTPNKEARNLMAYEIKRNRFKEEVENLKKINPNIAEEDLKKWQEKYDKESWTNRKKVYKDLIKEQKKLEEEQRKNKETEEIAKIKQTDKDKEKTLDLGKNEVIKSSIELINEDQAAEALKKLIAFNDKEPDDPDIIFWMEVAVKRIKEFGSGKKAADTKQKQIEEEIEKIAKSDEAIKDQIEEENLTTINIEGVKLNEERHQRKLSSRERAKEESTSKTQGSPLEQNLTKDFYEQTDEDYILNKEGIGEEVEELQFDESDMTGNERMGLKEKTRKKESQLFTKEGFSHIQFKDKSGRKISSTQAEAEKDEDVEKIEDQLAEKAIDKTNTYDLNSRIAAKRKAQELMDQETHSRERLRAA